MRRNPFDEGRKKGPAKPGWDLPHTSTASASATAVLGLMLGIEGERNVASHPKKSTLFDLLTRDGEERNVNRKNIVKNLKRITGIEVNNMSRLTPSSPEKHCIRI